MPRVPLCMSVSKASPVWHTAEWGRWRGCEGCAPTIAQKQIDQMLPFIFYPLWKFWARINFWLGKNKEVVSHLLSEKLREGKGGGKRGRGREKHCYNHTEFCLSICIYIYLHYLKSFGLCLLKYTISLISRKIAKKTSTDSWWSWVVLMWEEDRGRGQGRTWLLSIWLSSCTEVCLLVQQSLASWGRLVLLHRWMIQSSYKQIRPEPCPPPLPEEEGTFWMSASLSWCCSRRRHWVGYALGAEQLICSRGQHVWGQSSGWIFLAAP